MSNVAIPSAASAVEERTSIVILSAVEGRTNVVIAGAASAVDGRVTLVILSGASAASVVEDSVLDVKQIRFSESG
jgi:hypothetical protein